MQVGISHKENIWSGWGNCECKYY